MRWLFAIALVAACNTSSASSDAAGDDVGGDDAAIDAPAGVTWETVNEVANDGEVITEDVTYRSGSLLIRGHLCRPASGNAHPAVIYNHGGFQGLQIDPEAQRCHETARLGYVWLASSYRGEDGSEGQLEICLGEVDDVLAMLAIARAQPYVDANRIAMYGGSHGGCITERAVQRGAGVQVAIDLFGPTDWATLYAYWETQSDGFSQQLMSITRGALGGTPSQAPDAYAMRSPIHFVGDFPASVPFMVTHGTADAVVPVAQSCALAASGFASWHVDASGVETAAVPAGCTGVPSMTTPRPVNTWPDSRYLIIYDGLGHETSSDAATRMLQDAALFMMRKI